VGRIGHGGLLLREEALAVDRLRPRVKKLEEYHTYIEEVRSTWLGVAELDVIMISRRSAGLDTISKDIST
jgi:hypothetical protein